MKRANSVTDALNTGNALLDFGDNLPKVAIPLDGDFGGEPGPPGAGVPTGGSALQVIRKNAANTTTEWADVNKSLVGLNNVDNTSDVNKPVSNATQTALGGKADKTELNNKADLVGGKIPVAQLPTTGIVTDSSVAAQVNSPETGAEIDGRINTQVTPIVEQITADYVASDQAVIDAAAAAVNANPVISSLGSRTGALEDKTTTQALGTANLNDFRSHGYRGQNTGGNATLDRNYPVQGRRGVLTVTQVSGQLTVLQTFKAPSVRETYEREYYGSQWSDWSLVSSPIAPSSGVTEAWVQGNSLANAGALLGETNLDSLVTQNIHFQTISGNATLERGYPEGARRGVLLVFKHPSSGNMVLQIYFATTMGKSWMRENYSGAWGEWAPLSAGEPVGDVIFDDALVTDLGMSQIAGDDQSIFRGTINSSVAIEVSKQLPLADIPRQVIAGTDIGTSRPSWPGPVYWIMSAPELTPTNLQPGDLVIHAAGGAV